MRILVAVDESPCSEAAAAAASMYALPGNQLHVLHVVDWPSTLPHWYGLTEGPHSGQAVFEARDHMIARGEELVTRAAADLWRDGLEVTTGVVVGHVAESILQAAASWNADLIILGTHGRGGLDRMLVGSVAESVLRQAECPVETVAPSAALLHQG